MVSTRQAAAHLGVTERQVRRFIRAGLLVAQQFGDYTTAPWMITEESVAQLLVARQEARHHARETAHAVPESET